MVLMFEEKPSFHILTNTVKFFSTKYQNKVKNYYLQPKKIKILSFSSIKKPANWRVCIIYPPNTIVTMTMADKIPIKSANKPTFNASPIFFIPTAPKYTVST